MDDHHNDRMGATTALPTAPVSGTLSLPSPWADGVPDTALRARLAEACHAWLMRSPSPETRSNYARDLGQILAFIGAGEGEWEALASVRPHHVAAWRDSLLGAGLANSSVRRKMTALRSLYGYLKTYGYAGENPAHGAFVDAPAAPRDGKTVCLSPRDCRRLLDAPGVGTPAGVRDSALLAVLAYTGCRVGELVRLRVGDVKETAGVRVLEVRGKGGRERRVPLNPEACVRLEAWLDLAGIRGQPSGPLFRPLKAARGAGSSVFLRRHLTRRAVQKLMGRHADALGLDPAVTVHSLRVTALTTAREEGADVIDLQDFAGHADPRTTLSYIRNRDRLERSPAFLLRY